MSTPVYIIVIQDRHTDVEVEAWSGKQCAIDRARELAKSYANHPEFITEEILSGSVFYLTYSTEGDSIMVVKRELQ